MKFNVSLNPEAISQFKDQINLITKFCPPESVYLYFNDEKMIFYTLLGYGDPLINVDKNLNVFLEFENEGLLKGSSPYHESKKGYFNLKIVDIKDFAEKLKTVEFGHNLILALSKQDNKRFIKMVVEKGNDASTKSTLLTEIDFENVNLDLEDLNSFTNIFETKFIYLYKFMKFSAMRKVNFIFNGNVESSGGDTEEEIVYDSIVTGKFLDKLNTANFKTRTSYQIGSFGEEKVSAEELNEWRNFEIQYVFTPEYCAKLIKFLREGKTYKFGIRGRSEFYFNQDFHHKIGEDRLGSLTVSIPQNIFTENEAESIEEDDYEEGGNETQDL